MKKSLEEFLEVLIQTTQHNIDFLNDKEVIFEPENAKKYSEEIQEICDVINNFYFVKDKN